MARSFVACAGFLAIAGLTSAALSKGTSVNAQIAGETADAATADGAATTEAMTSLVDMVAYLPGTYTLFAQLETAACPVTVEIAGAGKFTSGEGLTNANNAENIAEIKHADLKIGGAQCEGDSQVLLVDSMVAAEPMFSGEQVGQFFQAGSAFFAIGADAATKTCGPLVARTMGYFFSNTMMTSQPMVAEANLIAQDIIPADDVIYMLMTEAFGGEGIADACWYIQNEPNAAEPVDDSDELEGNQVGEVVAPIADTTVVVEEPVIETEEYFPTPIPDDAAVCFPGCASVTLESGATKSMNELSIGDRVLVSGGEYSEVFMFTHKLADAEHDFVRISTDSKAAVTATAGHYIPVVGKGLVAAGAIEIGDRLLTAGGIETSVVSIAGVRDTGLFNPQTLAGDIAVDGLVASTYTMTVNPPLAHVLLAPMRAAFRMLGLATEVLESGSPLLAGLAPSGGAVAPF